VRSNRGREQHDLNAALRLVGAGQRSRSEKGSFDMLDCRGRSPGWRLLDELKIASQIASQRSSAVSGEKFSKSSLSFP